MPNLRLIEHRLREELLMSAAAERGPDCEPQESAPMSTVVTTSPAAIGLR
ncbi:hypothetical protein [Micromonospora sp. NPDC048843]